MKYGLPVKLGIFVVLVFSAVIAVCLLWTPVKVKYYTAKLGSEDPKQFNDSVSKLMEMGVKGKDAIVRTARYKWEHMDTARRNIIINNLIGNQNECIDLLTEVLEGGENEANFLVTHWADVNASSIQDGFDPRKAVSDTPIYIAVKSGWIDSVALLILRGAKVNVYNGKIGTPLCVAAEGGSKAIVKLLIDKGADVNSTGEMAEEFTPLMIALKSGHEDIAAILIDRGARIDIKDYLGVSAIHYAAAAGLNKSIAFLIEHGADVNEKDEEKSRTPLHYAADYNSSSIEYLIENGANVNDKDGYGYTPLHLAVNNKLSSIEYLIENGANVNARNNRGKTPLDVAMRINLWENLLEAVSLLRSHGAKTGEELERSTEYRVPSTEKEKKK